MYGQAIIRFVYYRTTHGNLVAKTLVLMTTDTSLTTSSDTICICFVCMYKFTDHGYIPMSLLPLCDDARINKMDTAKQQ
jgi:acyl-CoA synthetase (AMP-forming)/AMP-acid ligase II